MASNPTSPKRRCTSVTKKRLLQATKLFLTKKLSDLEDAELNAYLSSIGGPKEYGNKDITWLEETNVATWVLNRILAQLRKWLALQGSKKAQSDEQVSEDPEIREDGDNCDFPMPSEFRAAEITLVAYMVAHIRDVNTLFIHSHLLTKMASITTMWSEVTLEQLEQDGFTNPCLRAMETKEMEPVLIQHRACFNAICELITALYFKLPRDSNEPRPCNRICMGMNINDVATQIIELVRMLAIWNHALQRVAPAQKTRVPAGIIVGTLTIIVKTLKVWLLVMRDLLYSNTNVKNAYTTLTVKLMDNLLLMRTELEDFRSYVKYMTAKNGATCKHVAPYHVETVVGEVSEAILQPLLFALSKKVISGLRDTITSKDFSDLMEVDQLGNLDLENAGMVYNRRFFMSIVIILHKAENDPSLLQNARGLCIMLPRIFEVALEQLGALEDGGQRRSYYGVMMLAVLIPLVIKLAKGLKRSLEGHPNSYRISATYCSCKTALHDILDMANKNQLLVYSGEGSEVLTKLTEQAVDFTIASLEEGYQHITMPVRRKMVILEQQDLEVEDLGYILRKVHLSNHLSTDVGSSMYITPILWESLMLLVALDLEHADKNMQRILGLLNQDHILHDSEKYELEAFNILIQPSVEVNLQDKPKKSHAFLGNLIAMYSHANDMPALLDHIGQFITTSKANRLSLFMTHPTAILAMHRSSKESVISHIPIVLERFNVWIKKKKDRRFMVYPLMSYLSGVELSHTIVAKVTTALESMLTCVQADKTPEGLLMVIHALTTVRKINSWESMDEGKATWAKRIKGIYAHICKFVQMVGTNCSLEVWKALFWLAYHFMLIIVEHPTVYNNLNEGASKMLRRLRRAICHENCDRVFLEDAVTLLAANATVLRGHEQFPKLMKHAVDVLLEGEMDEPLLEKIKGLLEMLDYVEHGLHSTLDVLVLKKLIYNIGVEGSTTKMKSMSLSIVTTVLELNSQFYSDPEFVQLFHLVVEAVRHCFGVDDIDRPEVMENVTKILDLLLMILKREEQLGISACMESITNVYEPFVISDQRKKEAIRDVSCAILVALNSVKEAITLVPAHQMQRSIEILQRLARLYCIIIAGLMNHKFMKGDVKRRRVKIASGNVRLLLKGLLPTALTEESDPVVLERVEEGEETENHEDEFRKGLVDLVVLANVYKTAKEDPSNNAMLAICGLKTKKTVIDALTGLSQLLSDYQPKDAGTLMYYTNLIYCMAFGITEEEVDLIYGNIESLQTRLLSTLLLEPLLLELLREAIVTLLHETVNKSSENQLQSRVVASLFLVSCMQQIIYMRRRDALDNKGTQLEVFKALCSSQTGEIANIVQVAFEKMKTVKTWNTFTMDTGELYHQAEEHEAPYNWMLRAAAFDVLMLLMEKPYLKSLFNIRGSRKRTVLGEIEIFLNLYNNHLIKETDLIQQGSDNDTINWVLINYLMNTTVSIKMFACTRFIANKQLQKFHYAFSEQLLDLARMGIEFIRKRSPDDVIYNRVATNVYLCLYNCIRTVEGVNNAQAAKLARPWMKRVQVTVYIVTQFVSLIDNRDAELFACLARLIDIISNEQLRDATRWYLPHMLSVIINKWHDVDKDIATFKDQGADVLRSNRILKSCIVESIRVLDDVSLQAVFLLLPPQLRIFIKENTNLFDDK